ncbi:hypothetical protein GCM10007866_25820 [Gluconobacter albidus]|uniref:Uncharacterized protein n=1 Tax=Gluconobacter albidus TaxID=318683 RepID=A0ABQ5X351_9PROT|nr:hypothetical protein AA3250_1335 [Gluconobacter albidus NBRC 3250]GLQ70129.1 hypothetical protein GCM10007866_25820 [Gluconobacter albidus]
MGAARAEVRVAEAVDFMAVEAPVGAFTVAAWDPVVWAGG